MGQINLKKLVYYNQMSINWIQKLALIFMLVLISTNKIFSPLRVSQDRNDNDIQIRYYYEILDDVNETQIKYFQLIIPEYSDYNYYDPFTFCFRLRPTIVADSQCSLGNVTGYYDCLTRGENSTLFHYQLSPDFLIKKDQRQFKEVQISGNTTVVALALTISLQGLIEDSNQTTEFSYLSQRNQIYQVITVLGTSFIDSAMSMKLNYISTFAASEGYLSDNLLLQRNYQCYVYNQIYNYIFTGGVLRNGESIFFVAFINYSPNSTFQVWQGLSFSRDKSNRDMLGAIPLAHRYQDLYSLYASRPFLDLSLNVNGTNDWTLVGQSRASQSEASSYYYSQLYRSYITNDKRGDEPIMYKMNNLYCYAAYFEIIKDSTYLENVNSFSYQNKNQLHQVVQCFTPNLKLSSTYHLLRYFMPIIMLCLFWL